MRNKQEIEEAIIKLMERDLSEKIVDIKLLPASGSSRCYYRIFTDNNTYIATYNSNIEENIAFIIFSRHFTNSNLPVPEPRNKGCVRILVQQLGWSIQPAAEPERRAATV